jgi:hypothetical protein
MDSHSLDLDRKEDLGLLAVSRSTTDGDSREAKSKVSRSTTAGDSREAKSKVVGLLVRKLFSKYR